MKNSQWVVYWMGSHGKFAGGNAVCEQSEWDAMERARPGSRTLIQAGIASEGEAERVARTSPLLGNTYEVAEAVKVDPASTVEATREAEFDLSPEHAAPIAEASSVGVALLTDPDDLLLSVEDAAG